MERLEQSAGLDRALEALPTAKVLQERHAAGQGSPHPSWRCCWRTPSSSCSGRWSRPTCPTIRTSHARPRRLLPAHLRAGYDEALTTHPLRREIVATVAANAVVNRAGISFLSRLCDETGLDLPVLARAHLAARDVFDATETWAEIDALDLAVPAAVQNEMFLLVRRLVERAARWLVHHGDDRARPDGRPVPARRARRFRVLPELVGAVADAATATRGAVHRRPVSPPDLARRWR